MTSVFCERQATLIHSRYSLREQKYSGLMRYLMEKKRESGVG